MMKIKKFNYSVLLVCSIFCILISAQLLSEGMFFDGVTYATISRNLAEGLGQFWRPFYSPSLYPEFYEDPPLVFGIQSILFKILGDHTWVEKFYSVTVLIISLILIKRIWSQLQCPREYLFLPIMLFLFNGAVICAVPNNMLESTMMIFCLSSISFYLTYSASKKVFFFILSSFMVTLAFLCKGPTSLYIWTFPFWHSLLFNRKTFGKALLEGIVFSFISIVPILLTAWWNNDSYQFWVHYYNKQIVGSLAQSQTVGSRFFILGDFLINAAIGIVGYLLLFITTRKKTSAIRSVAYPFILTAICGVLPIIISLKQSGHYILTVYPIFSIGVGILVYPHIEKLNIIFKPKLVQFFFLLFSIVALTLIFLNTNKINRDQEIVSIVLGLQGENLHLNNISVPDNFNDNYTWHAYLMRYNSLGIVPSDLTNLHIISAREKEDTAVSVVLRTEQFNVVKDNDLE